MSGFVDERPVHYVSPTTLANAWPAWNVRLKATCGYLADFPDEASVSVRWVSCPLCRERI